MQRSIRSSFGRNLGINLLIVAVAAMMLLPLSMQMSRLVREQEVRDRRTSLENGLENLTQQLGSLRNLLTQTRSTDFFNRMAIIDQTHYPSDYYAMRNTCNYLGAIAGANHHLVEIITYFGDSDITITRANAFDTLENFARFYALEDLPVCDYLRDATSPAAPAAMFSYLPGGTIASPNLRATRVAFCYRLPLLIGGHARPHNWALLLVGEEAMFSLLFNGSLRENGCLWLTDAQGHTLTAYRAPGFDAFPNADAAGEWMEVTNTSGTLRCTAFLPEQYFRQMMGSVHAFIAMCLSACIAMGLLAACYAAWRQGLPMRRLLAEFAHHGLGQPQNPDEYAWIKANMLRIQSENRSVFLQLEQYQKQQYAATIERLLSGTLHTETQYEKAKDQLATLRFPLLVSYGCTGSGGHEGDDMRRMLLFDTLRTRLPQGTVFHPLEEGAFAMLLPIETDVESTLNCLRTVLSRLQGVTQNRLILGISASCEGVRGLSGAFEQARMRYAAGDTHDMLHTQDPEKAEEDALSLRFMRQLHQSLTMSDRAAACDGLHRVLFASELPQADLRMRFDTLRMLLLIVAHDQGQTLADLPAYRPEETPEALYAMLEKAALALCDRLTLGRGERHSARGDAVCAYAQAHYTQSDCCPATLAAYFVLSEKTLYTLLKEQTGVSPATYLQNLRMEHAARLLRETDLSVQQISEASGFAAFNTYYKAFKRLYGVTPSQYREQEGTQGTE